MRGKDFVRRWCADPTKDGGCGNLSVRSGVLFSYNMRIAAMDGVGCVLRSRGPSQTTNRHISYVRQGWNGNFNMVEEL